MDTFIRVSEFGDGDVKWLDNWSMFFGMVIYVNLGLASGYLEKTVGAEVEMELVVDVVMEVALTVVCRWVKVVLNGGSSEGGLQVGEGGVGTLDKLAWWLLVVLEWLQVHQGDRGSPVS